jgi:hypothetical protein
MQVMVLESPVTGVHWIPTLACVSHATHAGSHSRQNGRTSLLRGFRLMPCPYAVHGCEAGTLQAYSESACFDIDIL